MAKSAKSANVAATTSNPANPVPATTKATGKTGKEIFVPSAKVLSLDVGPKVLAMLAGAHADQEKADSLTMSAGTKKNQAQALTVEAILKGAGDHRVREMLPLYITGSNPQKNAVNEVLGILLGLKEIKDGVPVPSAAAAKFIGTGKEKAGSPAAKRFQYVRNNLSTTIKQAATAALGALDLEADVSFVKEKGTVMLSGPKVVEAFGTDEVVLDQRKPEGELKRTPSFAEVRRIAEDNRNVVRAPKTANAAKATDEPTDANAAVRSIAASLISAINRTEGKLDGDTVRSLRAVVDACNNVLPQVIRGGKRVA